jgi:hypothetical protein
MRRSVGALRPRVAHCNRHSRTAPVWVVNSGHIFGDPTAIGVTSQSFRLRIRKCVSQGTRAVGVYNFTKPNLNTSVMTIILMSLLASLFLGGPARAEVVPRAAEQSTQNCQTSTPPLERLASAIERGEVDYVRVALEEGVDVNETWRDLPAQICRSLLLRSVWYSQDEIFGLLLKKGADPRRLPRESLGIPVREGRVDMVRTLLALGLKPRDNDEIVRAALESHNMAMLDLLASSGVSINASSVPSWALTDDLTAHLVPKYLRPNDSTNVGNEACTVQELFGLLSPEQDGCEGTQGPLWLHFVVTGNLRMMELMIKHGADLSLSFEVWDNSNDRPFNAIDVAVRRKDTRMADLLRRAGAPPGIWGRHPVRGPKETSRSNDGRHRFSFLPANE